MVVAAPKFKRRASVRPDEILNAALEEFSERGFDTARMEDIAARARVSKGAIYLYFDSKDAVLKGLVEREVAPVADLLKGIAARGVSDPAAAIKLIIKTASAMTQQADFARVPRVVLSVAARFPEIGRHYRERVVDIGLGAIEGLLTSGISNGVFRSVDAVAAARMVIGPIMLKALHVHTLGGAPDASTEAQAEALADILFRGIAL